MPGISTNFLLAKSMSSQRPTSTGYLWLQVINLNMFKRFAPASLVKYLSNPILSLNNAQCSPLEDSCKSYGVCLFWSSSLFFHLLYFWEYF